jgi:hypothetical protein
MKSRGNEHVIPSSATTNYGYVKPVLTWNPTAVILMLLLNVFPIYFEEFEEFLC